MRALAAVVALLVVGPSLAFAQFRPVRAELTPIVESEAHPVGKARAALLVRLPEALHVQSNAPRDASLIPTVLTITPPDGVRVSELVFPKATDLEQAGQSQALAVFEHEFAIGVQIEVASATQPGAIDLPGELRYQACDDKLCYAPRNVPLSWTLPLKPIDRRPPG
jgi:thiol:disulfide interchange protein DsbD